MNRAAALLVLLAIAGPAEAQAPIDPVAARRRSIEAMERGLERFDYESWDEAQAAFADAIAADPGNHLAWYHRGEIHRLQEEWSDAHAAYARARELAPQAAMYALWVGGSQVELGEDGSVALEAAVKLEPRLFRAQWYLGRQRARAGDDRAAALAWTAACKANPGFGPGFVELSRLYLRWDDPTRAIAVLESGRNAGAPDVRAEIEHLLGRALEAEGRTEDAIAAYTRALDLRSDMFDSLVHRGLARERVGRKAEARADLEKYAATGAGSPFQRAAAGQALLRLYRSP